jgi:hypothetical protein
MPAFSPRAIREYLGRLPTTDLYFLNPVAELARQKIGVSRVRWMGTHHYLVGKTGVIVRYGGVRDVERLKNAGARRIVYVVDDDFIAGAHDTGLPEPYRLKLARFAESEWPMLRAAADVVVVPGVVLAKTYGDKARIIPPAWNRPLASTDHFAAPKHLEIVHFGTGSHRADLAMLMGPLARALDTHPGARLTLFAGVNVPGKLRSHKHLRLRRPLTWWRYKRALPKMRFHLAVYPLAPTTFNQARSANKFTEHAVVGAASLMTRNPALTAAAGSGNTVTFVDDSPDAWAAQIDAFLAAPQSMRGQVERARAHLEATDPLAYAALQWRDILAPEL